MKLTGRARIVVELDLSQQRAGYSTDGIGYLFERLLTGQEADMTNLANLGITVREVDTRLHGWGDNIPPEFR